jgi:polar amino acid transport system substrate-binding protein
MPTMKKQRSRRVNAQNKGTATLRRLNLWLWITLWIAMATVAKADDKAKAYPGFRHVDPTALNAAGQISGPVVLLADADFAPWSFAAEDGSLKGISVEIASRACEAAGLTCEIRATAFENLLQTLRAGAAKGVISGFKLDNGLAREFALTRPYFHSLGRFVVRKGLSLTGADTRSLAGRRLGFRGNTVHARFVEQFYNRSALTPFDTQEAMLEALRTGQIDVVFGDAVELAFWQDGSASRGCCLLLGKAYVHRPTFSRSLSFILDRTDPALRARLDAGLDQIESNGVTAEIFARYLPASVW